MAEWKATLSLPRALAGAAEAVLEGYEAAGGAPAIASFAAQDDPGTYLIEAYFPERPDDRILRQALTTAIGAHAAGLAVEAMPQTDWVSLSQSLLPPITAGRFHVYGAHAADTLKPGQTGLLIEAGQAFGTGRHETTQGCLLALDDLAGRHEADRALDVGTGSGVLALAIAKTWRIPVVMSDIDPVAVATATENAEVNAVPVLGKLAGAGVMPVTAAGLDHPAIADGAPYPLVVANILAEPLIALARDITGATERRGRIVLSGLLDEQADAVRMAYAQYGCREEKKVRIGNWPTLTLKFDN